MLRTDALVRAYTRGPHPEVKYFRVKSVVGDVVTLSNDETTQQVHVADIQRVGDSRYWLTL
jgi:hypothetical protein